MAQDISELIKAKSKGILDFLIETGQSFYIPPYQRQYSWKKEQIDDLFEDIGRGINNFLTDSDVITFIGTIITIQDRDFKTVSPIVVDEMPKCVLTIIDGQQRLTTVMMLITCLHQNLTNVLSRLKNKKITDDLEGRFLNKIKTKIHDLMKELESALILDKSRGDSNYRYYPKIIRAYQDQWSTKKGEAKYESNIAKFLFRYKETHLHYEEKQEASILENYINFFTKDKDLQGTEFIESLKRIQRQIDKFVLGDDDINEVKMPSIFELIDSDNIRDLAIKENLDDQIKRLVQQEKLYVNLLKLFIFTKFSVERVALTIVTAINEDSAFDMFESLNTAGQLLTPFETFKPSIIKYQTLEGYEKSEFKIFVDRIEKKLAQKDLSEPKKLQLLSEILIPFRLSEKGTKLSKNRNEQRKYLIKDFEFLGDNHQQRVEFVKHLAGVADFVIDKWDRVALLDQDYLSESDLTHFRLSEEALLCFRMLVESKHPIVIAPLYRFFQKSSPNDFEEALKAIAAFYILWRLPEKNTAGIDQAYRDLMLKGVEGLCPPIARYTKDKENHFPSLVQLKAALRHYLKLKGIESAEHFINKLTRSNAYENQKVISKFFLLLASNGTDYLQEQPHLVQRCRDGANEIFSLKYWFNYEIEHIAPQKPVRDNDWDRNIYQNQLENNIGNLVIIHGLSNKIISNRNWNIKKKIYSALAEKSYEKLNMMIQEEDLEEIKPDSVAKLIDLPLVPHLEGIAKVASWDEEKIRQRSSNIAQFGWEKISRWLDY
ncbi:MAG: DUF262 domain-containing protein [Cyanobacteria bacterium REEB446]|nr:DUF262 domain-containing protein [Cyanobacteria bacterium REEB446]